MVKIWLPRLPRNEQFYSRAPLVAIKDSPVDDLYVELVAIFDLKHHTCSNLVVKEVIYAARIDENGDQLLFKKSSNFHRLWVGVAGQRVHCVVSRLGLFLHGLIFGFEAFFRWFAVLILYWFNHEESALLQRCSRLHEGVEGFGMASRGATLILRTSWFNRSSWILTKKITAIRVISSNTLFTLLSVIFSPTYSFDVLVEATVDAASSRILLNLQSSALAVTRPFGSQPLFAAVVE
ncbi:hypothetical protein BHE74_00049376 [Ensete ventricosum]|nr:hypothetical protein BHE74_00049376 [Ensete ventricosum]